MTKIIELVIEAALFITVSRTQLAALTVIITAGNRKELLFIENAML